MDDSHDLCTEFGIRHRQVFNVVNQQLPDFIKDANATERIYAFGRVYYEDVGGHERETEF